MLQGPGLKKNTLWYTLGSIVQKFITFLYFAILARAIGVEALGQYSFALSFTSIFVVFIDLGINNFLIREVAREIKNTARYLGNIIIFKLLSGVIIYFIMMAAIFLLGKPMEIRWMVYLAGIMIIINNINGTLYSAIRGYQNLKYESIGIIIGQLIVFLVGLMVIFLKLPTVYLFVPLILSEIVIFFYLTVMADRKYQLKPEFIIDIPLIKHIIKKSFNFFWASFFGSVFGYIDIILLSLLSGDKAVGYYSAAQKIPNALRIFPVAFAASIYPTICYYFSKQQKEEIVKIVEKTLGYILLIVTPIVVSVFILARQIANIVYGVKFTASSAPLKIIIFGMFFAFLDYIFVSVLNASSKEKINARNRSIAMVAIILFDLLLIPLYQYQGAAMASTASFFILALLGFIYTYKAINFKLKNIFFNFLKILVISLAMGFIVYILQDRINFVFLMMIGILSYAVGILISGIISKEDLFYFRNLLKR